MYFSVDIFHQELLRLVECEPPVQENYIGRLEVICDWCQALHFPGETSRMELINGVLMRTFQDCCAHGKLRSPPLPYPDELKPLLSRQDDDAEEFHRRIRSYNSSCSFASINASTYNFPTGGPYCYRVHGAVVNKFNTAAIAEPNERPKYGQLFVIDSHAALEHRLEVQANEGLDERELADSVFALQLALSLRRSRFEHCCLGTDSKLTQGRV